MSYTNQDYPYLDSEDKRFAQAFRITEDEFLGMAGGLKAYTQFRLNRNDARRMVIGDQSFEVPLLPDNVLDATKGIVDPNVSEKGLAALLLGDQMKQVAGILDADVAVKRDNENLDRQRQINADLKEAELKRLASENPYRFPPDSKSARDWAEGQYQFRHQVKP